MVQEPVDLLINARWIAPVIPENTVYADCAVAINQGRIKGIHPRQEAARRYQPVQTLDLGDHLIIPGLVNSHGHLAMSLLRGYADDHPLDTWLQDHIWPAESKWVGEEFVRDGTELALAELLKSGTTCFADMYFFPDCVAQLAWHHGIRCQLAFPILNFSSAWARDGDEYLHKGLALHDTYRDSDLIQVAFGPHAPYSVDDRYLERVAILANEVEGCIQIHLHETDREVREAVEQSGQRPIERLQRLGLLTPSTQCVHMTAVNESDLVLLQQSRAHVIHCPRSNLKLANGFCPVGDLMAAGINVALGTDSAASNNSLDMIGEMQIASLLAKGLSGDPAALDIHQTLRMATLNGARALGLESEIGSLEPGKAADLVAIDMNDLNQQPMYNPLSQLVYTQMGHRVSHVWINGSPKVIDYQLQTFHEQELRARTQQWQRRIAGQPHG